MRGFLCLPLLQDVNLVGMWLPSRSWGKPVSATEAVGMKALIYSPTLEVYDPVLLPGLARVGARVSL